MNTSRKVLVAMSGGVDSSTTAILLREKGYEVSGAMMLLYGDIDSRNILAAVARSKSVAEKLEIPFDLIDLRKEFQKRVVEYFLKSHEQGLTPNPCFVCNQQIKWGLLLEYALDKGNEYLATGHYALILRNLDGKVTLHKALDQKKDQSYVLAGLRQDQLAHAILPLGGLTKNETREISEKYGLEFKQVKESQDLCFLNGTSQESYLMKTAQHLFQPGEISLKDGTVIGRHNGLVNYTIGQRKGLGAGQKEPIFVLQKCIAANRLIVGPRSELGAVKVRAHRINWISGEPSTLPIRVDVKIRYRSNLLKATIFQADQDGCDIIFDEPVRDPTPGQFAVFYEGDQVLGSGEVTTFTDGVNG